MRSTLLPAPAVDAMSAGTGGVAASGGGSICARQGVGRLRTLIATALFCNKAAPSAGELPTGPLVAEEELDELTGGDVPSGELF